MLIKEDEKFTFGSSIMFKEKVIPQNVNFFVNAYKNLTESLDTRRSCSL